MALCFAHHTGTLTKLAARQIKNDYTLIARLLNRRGSQLDQSTSDLVKYISFAAYIQKLTNQTLRDTF